MATWKATGVEHKVDYDSNQDTHHSSSDRIIVTKCGLTGWAAFGWKFSRVRQTKPGDAQCKKCFR